MIRTLSSEKLPIKLWLPYLEDGAEVQAKNLANLPFAFHHIVILPDSHQGYGMPIGAVMATRGVIIPNAVGVDIGCGMCALKTGLHASEVSADRLKATMARVREAIPVGNGRGGSYEDMVDPGRMPFKKTDELKTAAPVIYGLFDRARQQLGTLGGGNHFIEIQQDAEGSVWIMIHSGSRYLGKEVASHYDRWAFELDALWGLELPRSWQLPYLRLDTEPGRQYKREMDLCVAYALANREAMMQRVLTAFSEQYSPDDLEPAATINIAHNYAAAETHFGEEVIVHRKGATLATAGLKGIIPGSQGTKSYIVMGKGNAESFNSCSHGAGRRMGRKDATRKLNLADEIARMDAQGIIHGIRLEGDLDEAPGAYKDIGEVMAYQDDLVDILVELSPMAVIKG